MMCRPYHSLSFAEQQQQQSSSSTSVSDRYNNPIRSMTSLPVYPLVPQGIIIPSSSKKRSVRFATETNVCSIPSSLDCFYDMNQQEEAASLWYNPYDLMSMRDDARVTCEQMKVRSTVSSSVSLSVASDHNPTTSKFPSKQPVTLAYDSATRGLEMKICAERQKRRYVTVRFIVAMANKLKAQAAAQSSSSSSSYDVSTVVAQASQRCTSYAMDIATEEAARDYIRAYCEGEEMLYFEPYLSKKSMTNENNKRMDNSSDSVVESRNVRPRLSSEY
jgi:hypothetical protein